MSGFISHLKYIVLKTLDTIYPSDWFRIDTNKVVVSSFRGKPYSGNPGRIATALHALAPNLDIVWLALDPNAPAPDGVRVVKYDSLASYRELATAKAWVDDFRKKYFPRKKKGQLYYQVWHGVLPLKKIERDAASNLDQMYLNEAKRDGKNTDYMLAGNDFTEQIYENSFWFSGKVLRYGTPSLDGIIGVPQNKIAKDTKRQLGLSDTKKVLFYCPTFRDHFEVADFDLHAVALRQQLSKCLGGEWTILIRLHPNAREHEAEVLHTNPGAIGVTNFPDLSALIMTADLVVTDFSSVMFDSLYADRPTFILAQDYEKYINGERGVYDIINKLPFTVTKTPEELLAGIENFSPETYAEKRQTFLRLIGEHETGKSAFLLAKHILAKMKGETVDDA